MLLSMMVAAIGDEVSAGEWRIKYVRYIYVYFKYNPEKPGIFVSQYIEFLSHFILK